MSSNSYPQIIMRIREDVCEISGISQDLNKYVLPLPLLLSYTMLPQFLVYSSVLGLPTHILVHFVPGLGPSTASAP